jgi:hypothetical protein
LLWPEITGVNVNVDSVTFSLFFSSSPIYQIIVAVGLLSLAVHVNVLDTPFVTSTVPDGLVLPPFSVTLATFTEVCKMFYYS